MTFTLKIDESPFTKNREVAITSSDCLQKEVSDILESGEGSALLQHDKDDYLLFGVEGNYGFVQYDPGSKGGDYLWLKESETGFDEDTINFNVGGTDTEIYKHRIIDKDLVLESLLYFYEHGGLIEKVWEIDEV